jgi:endoglucanase
MRKFFSLSILLLFVSSFAKIATQYGRLYTDGNKIVAENSSGAPVQLKGPSMQWSVTGWGSDKFFRTETANALIDGWKAQIIRVPLGLSVSGGSGDFNTGYDNLVHREQVWNRVKTVADAAIAKEIYVIIDWHSHSAHDAAETELAKDFFTNPLLAGQYGNNPNVIFEIYNEPEKDVTWAEVKTYSNAVIKAIRDANFNNLILVGNPYWDTQTNIAANDPPADDGNNFALTFHFYANAHKTTSSVYGQTGKTYRSVVQEALDKNIPVFVSEWGTNDATEAGKPNFAETDKWHAYLDEKKISSCAWGATASGIYGENVLDYWSKWGNPLHYNANELANWTDTYRMTPHGRYIYKWLTGKDTTTAPGTAWPNYIGTSSLLSPANANNWSTLKDNDNGGVSTISDIKIVDGAAHFTYTLGKGTYQWDPYVGASFGVDGLPDCKYGISYQYKGSAHVLRAEQSNVKDYDFHVNYKNTPKTTDWAKVTIPWGFFWQSEWDGIQTAQRDSSLINNLTWYVEAKNGTSGELYVKEVLCLEEAGAVPIKPVKQQISRVSGNYILRTATNMINGNGNLIKVYDLRGNFVGEGLQVKVVPGAYVVSPHIP